MNQRRVEKYFNKAREIAESAGYKKHPTGCVVVYRGKIISYGCCSLKSHPLQKELDKERNLFNGGHSHSHSLHAETSALLKIRDLDINWDKVEIFVYRKTKTGFGLAKPCPSCSKLIRDMGIKTVYYTTNQKSYCCELFL